MSKRKKKDEVSLEDLNRKFGTILSKRFHVEGYGELIVWGLKRTGEVLLADENIDNRINMPMAEFYRLATPVAASERFGPRFYEAMITSPD